MCCFGQLGWVNNQHMGGIATGVTYCRVIGGKSLGDCTPFAWESLYSSKLRVNMSTGDFRFL